MVAREPSLRARDGHGGAQEADPWAGYFELTQSITKGMVEAVAGPLKDLKL